MFDTIDYTQYPAEIPRMFSTPQHKLLPKKDIFLWDSSSQTAATRRVKEKQRTSQPAKLCVYGLVDNQEIFYVGITSNPTQRLYNHFAARQNRNSKVAKRILSIFRKGYKPTMVCLEWTDNWSREGKWISFFLDEMKIPLENSIGGHL